MAWCQVGDLELNGDPPELAGLECEAFICEAFVFEGAAQATANVTYLKAGGAWWRLYFDCGIIFWRPTDAPQSYAMPEINADCPLTDVGRITGVRGRRILGYAMAAIPTGARVTFDFEDSRRIVLEDSCDRTSWRNEGLAR